ncbi:ATP-binding cassette domain-containing protein, partial [Escherichia coli]
MIRFEHVSKAYLGGRQALQGVTFHMQPGEMAFLTGHSGAGKSTLLKLICGIERPSAGKIWFSGHDITRLKNREVPFLRRQIGMIFQDHHLLMDRTVYDNVAIPLIIAGASGDDIRRRVSAALDKVAQHTGADSASVIFDAIQAAKARNIDVLIADTAGRLQNKSHL